MTTTIIELPTLKPCGCPSDAETYCEGVVVGHLEGRDCCEPGRYIWQADGRLQVGSLADYARQWQSYVYAGEDGLMGTELRTWKTSDTVRKDCLGTDEQDYVRYDFRLGGERVLVRIDGRF